MTIWRVAHLHSSRSPFCTSTLRGYYSNRIGSGAAYYFSEILFRIVKQVFYWSWVLCLKKQEGLCLLVHRSLFLLMLSSAALSASVSSNASCFVSSVALSPPCRSFLFTSHFYGYSLVGCVSHSPLYSQLILNSTIYADYCELLPLLAYSAPVSFKV